MLGHIKKTDTIFKIIFLVGMLIFDMGAYYHINSSLLIGNSYETEGTLVDYHKRVKKKKTKYYPIYEYHDKSGVTHQVKSKEGKKKKPYSLGHKISVYVHNNNPTRALPNTSADTSGRYRLPYFFGFIIAMAGLIPMYYQIKRFQLKDTLLKQGAKISTTITQIVLNTKLKISGVHPYTIFSTATLDGRNQITFKSWNILKDPQPVFGEQGTIDVYYDIKDPKRYYMDTRSLDA